MKKLLCLVWSLMLVIMVAGCGGGDKQAAAPQAGKTLRLAAAASMEKAFTQKLIPLYQQKHPEIKIEGVYDASGKLQAQIESGLAADVFVSAANKQMNALRDKGYMDKSTVKPLLENKLVLIVPKTAAKSKALRISARLSILQSAILQAFLQANMPRKR